MSELLIKAIKNSTEDVPTNMVYVIDIVSVRFGGFFTTQVQHSLQRYQNLQMLTLNDCGIVSLQNFPKLPNLIRLDMVFNLIQGEHLLHLRPSQHIQTLMLGANRIQTIEQVSQLRFMANLMQLDLINNPVYRVQGYRERIFNIFTSLIVLDTLDRSGKDAFNNVTMMETVSRIPQHLFSNQQDYGDYGGYGNIQQRNREQLEGALARVGSLESISESRRSQKVIKHKKKNGKKQENVFPVGRIFREMKKSKTMRVKKASAVFLSAVLEQVASRLLELAGYQCKSQRKHKITPLILKDCLHHDEEYRKMLNQVTFGTMGE